MNYRKRKMLAGTLAVVLAMSSVLGLSVPLPVKAASDASVTYRYKNNAESGPVKDRTGIRSVNIDNKIYYDIHDGDPEKRLNLADQKALFKAVLQSGKDMDGGTDSVISQWSSLAEQIYGTHSKVAARVNANGGFENNFTTENTRNKAGYADISDALAQPEEHVNGTKGKDYTKWSGLSCTTSLKEVRQLAADEIADAIHHKIKGSDVLQETESAENTLKQLNDDTGRDVVFSLVTCVDRAGRTFKYNYNTFGIAFYDFKLAVLAGDGLEYITKAQEYESLQQAAENNAGGVSIQTSSKKDPELSYYKNESTKAKNVGMELKQSHSLTTSNTLEAGKKYSYSEMINPDIGLSTGIPLLGEIEKKSGLEVTCGKALPTAYSGEKEYSLLKENKVSTNITLPAQTAAGVESSGVATNVKLGYDCPVAVTFKTAIFSLSGVVYDDNDKVQMFHTSGYRQGHFSTIFGTDSEKGGTTAMDNLYNRAVKYVNTQNYEETYGQTVGWSEKRNDERPADKVNSLDWTGILNGTINEDEVGTETAAVRVNRILVNDDGEIQSTFDVEDLEEERPVSYETEMTASGIYKLRNKTYYLYDKVVKNSNGEEVENEWSYDENSGVYSKWIQPIGKADKEALEAAGIENYMLQSINSVNFYYTEDTSIYGTQSTDDSKNIVKKAKENASSGTMTQSAGSEKATLKDKVAWLSSHCPMAVTGGVLRYDANSTHSDVKGLIPLYPLKKVVVTNGVKTLNMRSGDQFALEKITVKGTNKNGVDYYGFNQAHGHWALTDSKGKELKKSKVASIEKNKATEKKVLKAGSLNSDKKETVYLKYIIDEDKYKSLNSTVTVKNSELDATAMIKVNVTGKRNIRKGDIITKGIYRYRVTNSKTDGTGKVEVIGFAKKCSSKNVSIPKSISWNSVKYNVTAIGKRAFEANKKIKTVVLPDSIEKVGYKAFYRCSNLKKLTVGKNVTKMFAHAFCQNKKLKKIVFKGTKRMRLEKPHVFINVKNAKVYVPRSRYTTYKKLLCAYGLKKCKFVKQ